jgi:hypothetical protein
LKKKERSVPYIMHTARSVGDDTPTWSSGRYESPVGHKIKYEKEFLDARANAAVINTREEWENPVWRAAHERRLSAPVRPTLWPPASSSGSSGGPAVLRASVASTGVRSSA